MALPPEVLKQIKENVALAEKQIKEIEPEIEKAMLAGIDVSDQRKKVTELKTQVAKLKTQYSV